MAYFLKKTKNKKGIYLQIYFSYYDPQSRSTRHKSVQPIGYLHQLQDSGISDPISHFQLKVNELNQDFYLENQLESVKKIAKESSLKSIGFFPLSSIWDQLKVDQWLSTFQNGSKAEYNLALVSLALYG